MEPSPYISDFERQKKILFDRYMQLRQNYRYDSSNERYQWVQAAAKNQYHPNVKVNNWVEEQWDVDYLKHRKPLGGDFDYIYNSEYKTRYGDSLDEKIIPRREPRSFPAHQPELDLPPLKKVYDSYETTSRVAYQDPSVVASKPKEKACIYCRIHAGHIRQ